MQKKKTYTLRVPASYFYKVKAYSEKEARRILHNCSDTAKYFETSDLFWEELEVIDVGH